MSGQFVELQFSFRLDLEPILILLTSNNVQSWVALEDWALCVECSLANDKWGSRSAPPPRPAQWMNDRNLSGGLWCTVRQPKDFHIFFILSHHLTHKTHFHTVSQSLSQITHFSHCLTTPFSKKDQSVHQLESTIHDYLFKCNLYICHAFIIEVICVGGWVTRDYRQISIKFQI